MLTMDNVDTMDGSERSAVVFVFVMTTSNLSLFFVCFAMTMLWLNVRMSGAMSESIELF